MKIKKIIYRFPPSIWVQSFVFLFLMIATLNNIVGSPAYLGDPLWGLPEFYFSEMALRKSLILIAPILIFALLGDSLGFLGLEQSLINHPLPKAKSIEFAIHAYQQYREIPPTLNHMRLSAVNMIMRLLIIYYITSYGLELLEVRHYSQGNILQLPPIAGWYVVSIGSFLVAHVFLNKYIWSTVFPIYLKHGLRLTWLNQTKNSKGWAIILAAILRLGFIYIGIIIYMQLVPWACGTWCIQIIPATILGLLVINIWSHINKAEKTLSKINIATD